MATNTYISKYQSMFDNMVIKPEKRAEITSIVKKINSGKARYQAIENETKIPWFVIALIHYMECSNDFSKHLHNGDSLQKRTWQVPANRPLKGNPPFSFEASAVDALSYDQDKNGKIYTSKLILNKDWSIGNTLYLLETYNGIGYREYHPSVPSPYLWSYSSYYTKGKYGSDGKFSSNLVSKQAGVAVILKATLEANNLVQAVTDLITGNAGSLAVEVKKNS